MTPGVEFLRGHFGQARVIKAVMLYMYLIVVLGFVLPKALLS